MIYGKILNYFLAMIAYSKVGGRGGGVNVKYFANSYDTNG